MSEYVHLTIYFKTNNKLPNQELQGIFNKYFEGLAEVRREDSSDLFYNVVIHELALLETTDNLLKIIKHCHKNGREISISVTHGNVW